MLPVFAQPQLLAQHESDGGQEQRAKSTRYSISSAGPSTGALMRMKRKERPPMAASTTRRIKFAVFIVQLPSELDASPGRTFPCCSSPLVPFVIYDESSVGRKTAARLLVRPRAPVSLIRACPWACEGNSNSYWSDQAGLYPKGKTGLASSHLTSRSYLSRGRGAQRLNQYFSFARLAYGISRAGFQSYHNTLRLGDD